jgi:hypothetical protein
MFAQDFKIFRDFIRSDKFLDFRDVISSTSASVTGITFISIVLSFFLLVVIAIPFAHQYDYVHSLLCSKKIS